MRSVHLEKDRIDTLKEELKAMYASSSETIFRRERTGSCNFYNCFLSFAHSVSMCMSRNKLLEKLIDSLPSKIS